MKKITTIAACEIYAMLQQAKVTRMSSKDKYDIIAITCQLRKVAEEFDGLRREAFEKLRADNHEQKVGDKAYIRELTEQMQQCLSEHTAKKVEIKRLTEEAVLALIDSNDWALGDACKIKEGLT